MAKTVTQAAGIGSDAVHAKTGKTWDEWFAILDRAGAVRWTHKEIAKHLFDECGCPGWWSQMVTVGYEQERGLRVKHQLCSGEFSTSASKTMGVALDVLFASWNDAKIRAKWLPDSAKITIRKANVNKSMRINWLDGTSVEVNFLDKGPAKSVAAVQHSKLDGPDDVARMKAYWASALMKLQELLEKSTSARPTPRKTTSVKRKPV